MTIFSASSGAIPSSCTSGSGPTSSTSMTDTIPMAETWSSTVESTPSISRSVFSSVSSPALNSSGVRISTSQSVSRAARRTFCPRLPIARLSCDSDTTTVALPSSKHSAISEISAGFKAFAINTFDDSFQRTMSIFSPPSSSTIFFMRLPRMPTHAPTASTFGSRLRTATFVR